MKLKLGSKLFDRHKKRVEKVKDFTSKNKIFVITMIIAVIFLLINFVFVPKESQGENPQGESETIISENVENETGQSAQTATTNLREQWRFYFIDVIILVAGGGFCVVMILRQRRKTREELK
jgi:hypothetical protein